MAASPIPDTDKSHCELVLLLLDLFSKSASSLKVAFVYVDPSADRSILVAGVRLLNAPTTGTMPLPDPHGVFQTVSRTGRPMHLVDCGNNPQWPRFEAGVGSAYLVRIECSPAVEAVMAVLSREAEGVPANERLLADSIASLSRLVVASERRLQERIGRLEACFGELASTLELVARNENSIPASPITGLELLSRREREVLDQLLANRRVAAVARQLHISPHTVRNHLKSIFRKLEVNSQSELLERCASLVPPRRLSHQID